MTSILVNLNMISDLKAFVNMTSNLSVNVTLKSGQYVVDGKSIMGIFSLDLTKPIECIIETDDIEVISLFAPFEA